MTAHWLDRSYASLSSRGPLRRGTPLFARGWGDEAVLRGLEAGLRGEGLAARAAPLRVGMGAFRGEGKGEGKGHSFRDGTFLSPAERLTGVVRIGHLRHWSSSPEARLRGRDVFLVLAGSREEGYGLREAIWGALVPRFDLLLLENPFYGIRRPPHQATASVETVAEHLTMNLASVEEARALLAWARAEGARAVGIAGYSMGGYMAALVAATSPFPVAVAALAAGASPRPVFCDGCLSWSIDFAKLGGRDGANAAKKRLGDLFDVADVTRFDPPLRPDAASLVGFDQDGFVPEAETRRLHAHWKGSTLSFGRAGHVSALFTERAAMRRAMSSAFDRLVA